jgi:alpha-L-fucosidase-like protein
MAGVGCKLMPREGYDRSGWKKLEEDHTKTFAQSDALSRGSFLKVMLTGAASALSVGTGFARSLRPSVSRRSEPLVRGLTQDTRLYGSTAVEIGGKAKLDGLKISVDCSDSSSMKWNVTVPEEGEFDLFLSYALSVPGFKLEIRSGSSSIKVELKVTEGVYQQTEGGWFFNFERIRLDSKLHLTRGVNPVTVQVSGPEQSGVVRFRCLEILPVSGSAAIIPSEERVRAHRANTDWFVKAGYGVMFHWTDFTQPREGEKKPYKDAVDAFDVNAFANMVEEMRAGYVVFTLNHAHPHCAAPIQSWEASHPGWTTRRDLIGDLADALEARSIRFLLYINSPILTKLGNIGPTGLYQLTFSEEQFAEIHRDVLGEIGARYGERLAGYWFDSWYQSLAAYPDVPIDAVYRACKVGNPGRITCFNFWIFPVLTPYQDYWAGELNSLQNPFASRYIQRGAGKGLQAHGLLSMLDAWVHGKPGPIPAPQFSAEDLIAYVRANIEHQAVTTINIGIYQDGTVEQTSLDMMRQLRRAIRGK